MGNSRAQHCRAELAHQGKVIYLLIPPLHLLNGALPLLDKLLSFEVNLPEVLCSFI